MHVVRFAFWNVCIVAERPLQILETRCPRHLRQRAEQSGPHRRSSLILVLLQLRTTSQKAFSATGEGDGRRICPRKSGATNFICRLWNGQRIGNHDMQRSSCGKPFFAKVVNKYFSISFFPNSLSRMISICCLLFYIYLCISTNVC